MPELHFRDDPEALERLVRASNAVEDFIATHSRNLSKQEHEELRDLLRERASALSGALGQKVETVFND